MHLETISKIRREAQATLEELERNKHLLQLRLEEGLQNIADQCSQLECAESVMIDEIFKEDKECQILAGKYVEDTIAPSEASFSTAVDAVKRGDYIDDDTDSANENCDDDGVDEEWGRVETKF